MREVLKALKFLHDRSIAHLDLKPQNILLAGERIEGEFEWNTRLSRLILNFLFTWQMASNCVTLGSRGSCARE